MANGTIAFDTLSTSGQITGTAKSVDTDYVVNGSAKAWLRLNGTGTIAIRDSFNIASNTDNATGTTTTAFTNVFNNDEFATTGMHSSTAHVMQVVVTNEVGSVKFRTQNSSFAQVDDPAQAITVHGDLA